MELILYVNEDVEPLVEKPVVAIREKIIRLTSLEEIYAIDLSSDDEETSVEKYDNFWKIKEEERDLIEGEANILDILACSQEDIQLSPVNTELPETNLQQPDIPSFKDVDLSKPSNQPPQSLEIQPTQSTQPIPLTQTNLLSHTDYQSQTMMNHPTLKTYQT
ncbi:hypothetical protein L6452_19985 [Arctium lappa]|uniref:Uncharacterized protein n=1 Tax=Arctium lappa TaxID=4217 RepID=A0ACB9BEI0_ARCLA|nr:hypothetical protein L6452_19985 [Arctium lappa]